MHLLFWLSSLYSEHQYVCLTSKSSLSSTFQSHHKTHQSFFLAFVLSFAAGPASRLFENRRLSDTAGVPVLVRLDPTVKFQHADATSHDNLDVSQVHYQSSTFIISHSQSSSKSTVCFMSFHSFIWYIIAVSIGTEARAVVYVAQACHYRLTPNTDDANT